MTHPMANPVINVDFIQQRERSAVKQAVAAVTALHDALALKQEIRLPVLAETRDAILELEERVTSLKMELLRAPHPDQLMLPGMDDASSAVRRPEPDEHCGVSAVVTVLPA